MRCLVAEASIPALVRAQVALGVEGRSASCVLVVACGKCAVVGHSASVEVKGDVVAMAGSESVA